MDPALAVAWGAVAVLVVLSWLGVRWARRHAIDPEHPPNARQMALRITPFAGFCLAFAVYSAATENWLMTVLGATGVVLFAHSWLRYRRLRSWER